MRRKYASLRQSLPSSVSWVLLLSLFVGLPAQVAVSPSANALYFGTGYTAAPAGNAGGGTQNGNNVCATDKVAVGVGFTVNGSSPGFGVYCRSIGADGQLVDQDQSSASNTTAVGGGNTKVFCAPGKVVTGFSFVTWTNVRIRCATPPLLGDAAQTAWGITYTSGTEQFSNCTSGIVAGFYTRTGAWTDAIGAYCLPYALNTVTYSVNGGSGSAPSSQTQTQPAQSFTVSNYSGTRSGFHLSGWNTAANGTGTDYAAGGSIVPIGPVTLYAKWLSYINYDGNTQTAGTPPDSTTAVSSAAITSLATNSGNLVKTGYTFAGWNTAANGSGTDYPAGVGATYSTPTNLVLYAKWQANTYLISYNGNGATGGTAPLNGSYLTGSASPYAVENNTGNLAKTGFTFDGWYTTASGTGGTAYAAGTGTLTTTSDLTLYAKWSAASYAVTYVTGVGASTAPTQANTMYGSTFTLPAAPTQTIGSSSDLLESMGIKSDAPLCMTCGVKMRMSGACFVCEGCGNTSGCS